MLATGNRAAPWFYGRILWAFYGRVVAFVVVLWSYRGLPAVLLPDVFGSGDSSTGATEARVTSILSGRADDTEATQNTKVAGTYDTLANICTFFFVTVAGTKARVRKYGE